MKKWILGAAMLICQFSFSQISINSTHMPQAGDTLRFSRALLDTSVLLNYQNSGANLTWNFDSLRVISQGVQEFLNGSQTPYNAGSSRIGLLFADTLRFGVAEIYDAYNFLTNTTSDFSIDYRGASAPNPIPIFPPILLEGAYIDKDEVFQFPLDYQDRDSSTFNFTFDSPLGIYYESRGHRINNVDAWGTVTTPFGTFNTIRVVTDMVSFDTISALGQNFAIPSHIREYQWISDQERIAVMKVGGTVIGGNFIPTTVEFRDSFRVIEPLIPSIALFTTDTTVVSTVDSVEFQNLSVTGLNPMFNWSFNPPNVLYIEGSPTTRNVTVNFTDTGFYDVRLIARSGSDTDVLLREDYIQVVSTTGLANIDQELSHQLSVYPNPSSKGSLISIGPFAVNETVSYQIFDMKGALLYDESALISNGQLSISKLLNSGVFYIKINTKKGVALKKWIIE